MWQCVFTTIDLLLFVGNENETPSKGLIACQQGRKRLLMSPPHASPMKVS